MASRTLILFAFAKDIESSALLPISLRSSSICKSFLFKMSLVNPMTPPEFIKTSGM